MRTLSDSELTAVSGGATRTPYPYPSPYPDDGGIPRPLPIFPDFDVTGSVIDYARFNMS